MLTRRDGPDAGRLLVPVMALFLFAFALLLWLFVLQGRSKQLTAAASTGRYTIKVTGGDGVIYDRTFQPLTNQTERYRAVVNPTPEASARLVGHTVQMEELRTLFQTGKPFVCDVDSPQVACADVTVFPVPVRYGGAAVHLLGYRDGDGVGVSGLEAAYDQLLREQRQESTVVYTVNGQGELLGGIEKRVDMAPTVRAGVVTTLDREIQQICEEAIDFSAGAAVVLDVQTGEIRALVSVPDYDPNDVAASLEAENSPFLNRALCAYGVGSVFKIVTAAAALQSGLSPSLCYQCTGAVDVRGQLFRCHDLHGHGWLDMRGAMVASCNTYFITLSRLMTADALHSTASAFGFGEAMFLADGIRCAAGNLPSREALSLPAEQANFAFGQGQLTAAPLQVARMTCAVAGDGMLPACSLVRGVTTDGRSISVPQEKAAPKRVLTAEVATALREMLCAAVDGNPDSKARPSNTEAAGKTSTAQTGRYGADGKELCHAWMTGYFPAAHPRYAVTVFAENGGSGNVTAAPVFRRIVEQMTAAGF